MPAREVQALLAASPLFAGLPAREIEALAGLATEHAVRARDFIFVEGEPARALCVVRSGRVKILRQSRAGKDVVLEMLGPSEIFGGVAVIERRPYPASAQALEPSVILKIPAEAIIPLAERYPSIIREMALVIGRRLRAAHDSVKSLAADPVEARLAATVLRLGGGEGARGPDGLTLSFHLTRQGLADMAGTTVETTIRILSRWIKDGLLVDDGARLVLPDVERLREIAEGEVN
jgi:CRP/FNR family transcriptional regulator